MKPCHLATATSDTHARPEQVLSQFGQLHVLDDLIRLRARDTTQDHILAYPVRTGCGAHVSGYEYFTGLDLDRIVNRASQLLLAGSLQSIYPRVDGQGTVIALLTLSDLNMIITLFALSRLGCTVMILSPRLSATACLSLLNEAGCGMILHGGSKKVLDTAQKVKHESGRTGIAIQCHRIPDMHLPGKDAPAATSFQSLDKGTAETRAERTAVILHSSGTTGMPKPIYLTHKALMTHPPRGPGLTSFNTLPWYHQHGLSTAFQAMYMRRTAFLWDPNVPLTAASIVSALRAARPESVHAVPYGLQLIVDDPEGLDLLRSCKLVTYGGAPCPDELGNRLVQERVNFGGMFGL